MRIPNTTWKWRRIEKTTKAKLKSVKCHISHSIAKSFCYKLHFNRQKLKIIHYRKCFQHSGIKKRNFLFKIYQHQLWQISRFSSKVKKTNCKSNFFISEISSKKDKNMNYMQKSRNIETIGIIQLFSVNKQKFIVLEILLS